MSASSSPLIDGIDALKLFEEDVKDDEYETIISAVQRLPAVAAAIGPIRTRQELIIFLNEISEQDNDEALTGIARSLGEFVDLIGGGQYCHLLFPLLEKFAGEEEVVVRDAAVESLNKIVVKTQKSDIVSKYIPMLKRLANGDWFTTRVSACGLFASVYPLVADNIQSDLRSLFVTLCNDDTPMVRKAAFTQLGKFAICLQKQYFKSDIYPIVRAVATDDIDYMRVYAIDSCATLAKVVDNNEFGSVLFPLIEGLQDDSSWRVRQQLANAMPELCANIQPEPLGKKLVPIFAKLLRDKETEVRTAACKVMAEVCGLLKTGMIEFIAPVLEQLAVDSIQNVRVAFASSLVGLCPIFGKETSAKLLVPIIQQLTKDEYFEVRYNIINKMEILSESIGPAGIVASVLPALLELAKDPKWRVRHGVIEKSALLGQILGQKTWEKRFQSVLIGALTDHVFAIREAACEQIGLIVKEYGGKWAAEKLLPQCFQIYDKNTNYLHRMTCLMITSACSAPGGMELAEKTLLPIVIQACTDDVPNVRLGAAKASIDLIIRLDPKIASSKLVPLLQKMHNDTDGDVVYFSQQAVKKFNATQQ